jgi:hypothetical protein
MPFPTRAQASFGVSTALGTGFVLQAEAWLVNDAPQAVRKLGVSPEPDAAMFVVQSSVRMVSHVATVP